jgi:23S rRNA (adenine2030-N6)-methyltransferase
LNYRHAFHAGNHADVLKHAALVLLLRYLQAKEKSLFILDTHAGRGLYDLGSEAALRSGEFRLGAARVLGAEVPEPLRPYQEALKRLNPGGILARYPGSPLLIAEALRKQDRSLACDLHPEEAEALGALLRPWRRARVESREGYQALKAFLPPPERRGLVLIDPPFEQKTEFSELANAIRTAWKRFPEGTYLVWYPLKDRAAADGFLAAVREAGIADSTVYELFVRAPESAPGMAGSGLLAVNASYAIDTPMREILVFLARLLSQGPGARWSAGRLTAE